MKLQGRKKKTVNYRTFLNTPYARHSCQVLLIHDLITSPNNLEILQRKKMKLGIVRKLVRDFAPGNSKRYIHLQNPCPNQKIKHQSACLFIILLQGNGTCTAQFQTPGSQLHFSVSFSCFRLTILDIFLKLLISLYITWAHIPL